MSQTDSKVGSFLSNTNEMIQEGSSHSLEDPNIQSALPFLEKRLSNYENVDLIENNPANNIDDEQVTCDNTSMIRELSNEFDHYEKESFNFNNAQHFQSKRSFNQSHNEQNSSNFRFSNGEEHISRYSSEYQEKCNFEELNEVYTKELKQCDFQLTYMKTEYKKEYLRFEFISKLNHIIYNKERTVLSWPNCLQINSNYFVVGGGSGNFIVFSKLNYEYEIFSTQGSLRKINCIEMSEDFRVICIGDSVGTLGIYDMKKKKVVKFLEGLHGNQAIMSIKIINNKPNKLNNLQVITSDINGQVKVVFLTKGMFKYSVSQKILIEKKSFPIQQITLLSEDLKAKYQRTENSEIKYLSFISVLGIQIYSYSIQTMNLNLIYQFKNKDFIPSQFSHQDLGFVNLCWGEGFIFEVAGYLYKTITKVICWKNKLYILKVLPNMKFKQNSVSELPFLFEESNPLIFEKNIIHSCFLAQSIILIVDSDQYLYLFNMSDLKKLFNTSLQALDICKENGTLPFPLPVKEKFFFQLNKMSGNSAVQTYNNVFSQSNYDQELLFIVDGKMGVCALAKWQSVYNNLIENGEWRQAMHYLTNIYYNKDKFVTNLSSNQNERKILLEESVKIVSNKYLQMCFQVFNLNKDEVTKRDMIGLIVEFLVLTENYEFLFNELKLITEEHFKCSNLFIECLVPFLRKYKIKYIPVSYLNFLIDYFEQRNQISLIEKMILQLDTTLMNTHQLMELCLKKRLTKALIYICTKGEEGEDIYMTPLSKMWGHHLFHKYQQQQLAVDPNQNKVVQSENGDDDRIFGERSLWYARICLKKHTIMGEDIEDKKYESLVYNLAQWVFNINNLNEILLFSPVQGFEIIHLFFTNNVADIINKKQFSQVNKNEKQDRNSRLSISLKRTTSNTLNESRQNISNYENHSNGQTLKNGNHFSKEFSHSNSLNSNFMNNFVENNTVLDEILETIQVCFEQIMENEDPLYQFNFQNNRNSLKEMIFDSRGKSYSHDSVNGNIIGQIKQEYYLLICKLFLEQHSENNDNLLKSDHILNLNDSGENSSKGEAQLSKSKSSFNNNQNLRFHLKKGQIFDAIIYLIQNPLIINVLSNNKDHPTPHITLIEWDNQLEVAEIYQGQFIQFVLSRVDFDKYQIQTLNNLILNSFGFNELKANIYKEMKEYKKSFDLFITSKNQLIQNRLFNWLSYQLSGNHQQNEHYNSLLQIIEERLIEIIKINPEKTRELIKKHLSETETRMIRKMKDFPEKQLEYIQKVLEERDEHSIPKDLLTLYIELLCTLNPSIILQELEKYDYDLDACLNLCKINGINDACAYLYEKQGDIQSSFMIHIEYLKNIYQEIIKAFEQLDDEQEKNKQNYYEITALLPLIDKLNKEIQKLFNLCKINMPMNGLEECVRLIQSLLDLFIELLAQKDTRTSLSEDFYYNYIGQTFIEMLKYVDLDYFIEQLSTKYIHLNLKKLSNTIANILSDLEYTLQTYINTSELLKEFINDQTIILQKVLNYGFNGYPVCQICFQGITNPLLSIKIDNQKTQQTINGWILPDYLQDQSAEKPKEESQKIKFQNTILFKCNHYYHDTCYFQAKEAIQSELQKQKSILVETPLCLLCYSEQSSDIYMNLLIQNEIRQKNIKENLAGTVQTRNSGGSSGQQKPSCLTVEQMKKPLNNKAPQQPKQEQKQLIQKQLQRKEQLYKFDKIKNIKNVDKKQLFKTIIEY
ncbi:hypothetical protein ABPG74_000058 [Tetrahymena malaccensis]